MILHLKKSIKKQAKVLRKETEKICKKLEGKGSSAEFDTNAVLIKMDSIESELRALREVINYEKERAYVKKMEAAASQRTETK